MNAFTEAVIEADPTVPIIRIIRDFAATPEQLLRAHTDPDLFAQWIGPTNVSTRIDYWDARSGGSWRFINFREDGAFAFKGAALGGADLAFKLVQFGRGVAMASSRSTGASMRSAATASFKRSPMRACQKVCHWKR